MKEGETKQKTKKLEPFEWLAFYQMKADELGTIYFRELRFLYFPEKVQFIVRSENGALVYMELNADSKICESNFKLSFENKEKFLKYFPKFEIYEDQPNLKHNNFYNVEQIKNVLNIYKLIIQKDKNRLLTDFLNPLN